MDPQKIGRNLVNFGLAATMGFGLWSLIFYLVAAEKMGVRSGTEDSVRLFQCIILDTEPCVLIKGLARLSGYITPEPFYIWASIGLVIVGLVVKNQTNEGEKINISPIHAYEQQPRFIVEESAGSLGENQISNKLVPAKNGIEHTYAATSGAVFNREKWNALVRYDPELAAIVQKLEPIGAKWVDKFAADFLVLGDKSYLPEIVWKIISEARTEARENEEKELRRQQARIAQIEHAKELDAKAAEKAKALRQQLEEKEKERELLHQQRRDARRYRFWGTPFRGAATIFGSVALLSLFVSAGWWAWLQMERISQERIEEAKIQPVRESLPSNMEETYPAAFAALRRTLPAVLTSAHWIYYLQGTQDAMTILDRNGTQYLLGWVCKPHDCGANQFVFLVSVDGSRAVSGIRSNDYGISWYGGPSTSEAALINAKMH